LLFGLIYGKLEDMEKRKKMPRSVRKFIRTEKARIRRQFLDTKKQESEIAQLYKRLTNDPTAEIVAVKEKAVKKSAPKAKSQKAKKRKSSPS
jgi:hypothetical protein